MDLEPALEALSLVHDSEAGRRLDLICLDVPHVDADDAVESKKRTRRVKRTRRKPQASSSSPLLLAEPLPPPSHSMASFSLSDDLRTRTPSANDCDSHTAAVHEQASQPETPPLVLDSPAALFSDLFWSQVSFDKQSDEQHAPAQRLSCETDTESRQVEYDFLKPVR